MGAVRQQGLAFECLDERRDGAVERGGNGPEQLGFAVVNLAVSGDGLGAGEQDIPFHAGSGLSEPVESRVHAGQAAVLAGEKLGAALWRVEIARPALARQG